MEEKIKARIEALKKEREEFVTQANAHVRAYAVAIAELEALIAPSSEKQPTEYIEQEAS